MADQEQKRIWRLGIDVGGTNTDAVLIDEDLNVVAAVKNPTSGDIYNGIMGAVDAVLADSGVDRAQIGQAMLGTTQCTNAIVERKGLAPIAILRIGAPASVGIPPMVDWAQDIAAVSVDAAIIEGGFEYDGKRLAELRTKRHAVRFRGRDAGAWRPWPSHACSPRCETTTSCMPPRSRPRSWERTCMCPFPAR